MNKLVTTLGLMLAIAALGGCDLYFGNGHNGNWSYCGSDGQYQCSGDNCHWVSPTCTDSGSGSSSGGGSGSSTTGYSCTSSQQCAAGCYCSNGVCTEGGFCSQNSDCGAGYYCDTSRSSCTPGCAQNSDCPAGNACINNTCTATCTCTTDADAVKAGYGWCDNGTCAQGTDPNGSCGGSITCTTAQPTCPSGQVPTISNGCWTGNCEAYSACDVKPACTSINDETDCLGQTGCAATYTGLNCTNSQGTSCTSGSTGCTCQSFVFATCTTKTTMSKVVIGPDGQQYDPSTLLAP